MWSHYTEKHTGFVLEFDSEKMGIKQEYLIHVEYRGERVTIKPTLDTFSIDTVTQMIKLLGRKYSNWYYEEEIRIQK